MMALCLFGLEARERRGLLEDSLKPTKIVLVEYGDPIVEYTVMGKSRELQRQALLAFKLQQFEDSESCYSLAFKESPGSKDIVVEYIFCSLLVPITSKAYSLARAEKLMQHLENLEDYETDRYFIAKALIENAQGNKSRAIEILSEKKFGIYADVSKEINSSLMNDRAFHVDLLEKLLPIRLSPREKRSNRR
jgi:cellulose biosynthesis protein BcsQ